LGGTTVDGPGCWWFAEWSEWPPYFTSVGNSFAAQAFIKMLGEENKKKAGYEEEKKNIYGGEENKKYGYGYGYGGEEKKEYEEKYFRIFNRFSI
jgi:hypothetical protein